MMTTTLETKKNIHTISILVNNKPGVLVRVALVFARRGFNIDSLVVSPAFDSRYSRMTITAQGDPQDLDQIIKQAFKLVDVIHAEEHTDANVVHKELALIKVKNTPTAKTGIKTFLTKFKANVIEEDTKSLIIEQTGTTAELDALEVSLKKFGVLEMVRSGKLVMAKGLEAT